MKVVTALAAGFILGAVHAPALGQTPVHDWSGLYAGLNLGYARGDYENKLSPNQFFYDSGFSADRTQAEFIRTVGSQSVNTDGFIGGVQVGYNVQAGALVVGLEADISSTRVKSYSVRGTYKDAGFTQHLYDQDFRTSYLGTLRGRVGLATGRLLMFGTGGLAYGERTVTGVVNNNTGQQIYSGSASDSSFGWVAGGGAAYALSSRLSLDLEYLYVDLGTIGFSATRPDSPGKTLFWVDHQNHFTNELLRASIKYRF